MNQEKRFCPAVWFSGFFGLGAVAHAVRLVFRVPVTVGSFEVPPALSAALVVVFTALSAGLLCAGLKRPCCEKKELDKDGEKSCCDNG